MVAEKGFMELPG